MEHTLSNTEEVKVQTTVSSLVRVLKHAVDRGGFSADTAEELALRCLARPGGPWVLLSAKARGQITEMVRQFAKSLAHDPAHPRLLYTFARDVAAAAWSLRAKARHPGARMEGAAFAAEAGKRASVHALAKAAVFAESARALGDEELVRRAVTRALRESRKSKGRMHVPLTDGDPLRRLFDLPEHGPLALPRNDVRNKIARMASKTHFGEILRTAARFHQDVLEEVLGVELFALCKPVGFSDASESQVIVEVSSSAAMQEVQLRSLDIVQRLRAHPHFSKVKRVRGVLATRSAIPSSRNLPGTP